MFSSQFDGTAAFSGGGFMSQFTQATDSTPSPAKSRETHGICPVTVKQISEASHSGDNKPNFLIDGVDVANLTEEAPQIFHDLTIRFFEINGSVVTLVGMVFDKAERVTDVGFTLDDGTGRIGCKRWVNETLDKKEMEDVYDGMYVRLFGHLNTFQGQRQIVAFSLRPVTNFDEVTFHFIQCIHVHLQNSRIKLQGDAPSQSQTVNPSQSSRVQSGSNGYQTAPSSLSSGQISVDGLKGFDQMVLDYLQQPSNFGQEKGIHRDELSRQLKIPVEKIMESIRTLEEEGLIYSTIDEFHFKSTVSG